MRVAYLINQYPKVSHTFIRREIHALERQGIEVNRIAIRGSPGILLDNDDKLEQEKTRYVLGAGATRLLAALFKIVLSHPLRFFQALCLTLRMSLRSDRPPLIHLVYLVEACLVQTWLIEDHIEHLHAHFGTNSAEVAMLTHVLGGPQWSFTVHGPEEFDKPEFIGLPEKIRRCAHVIAISSFGRSQLFRLVEPRLWPKIRVVHCGLESAFYQNNPSSSPLTRSLVCVGRLCEQKGQVLLLDAARRLLESATKFELVLAGDGEMRGELETLISRYKLEGVVRITGWVSNDQVRDEILAARALVLPSFAEGLPVVIMEAMALRRPVISTFVAGIPELINSGELGWLIPAGDSEALTSVMQACLDTPFDTIAQMGDAAHARALERHDVDKEVAKLIELFKIAVAAGDGAEPEARGEQPDRPIHHSNKRPPKEA
jgi:colanic acid/amylovoran biosynthesis glycosyltransferase